MVASSNCSVRLAQKRQPLNCAAFVALISVVQRIGRQRKSAVPSSTRLPSQTEKYVRSVSGGERLFSGDRLEVLLFSSPLIVAEGAFPSGNHDRSQTVAH